MKAYYRKKYYSEHDDSKNANILTKIGSFLIEKPMNLVRNITVPQLEDDTWVRGESALSPIFGYILILVSTKYLDLTNLI
jgi:hypothetical protein